MTANPTLLSMPLAQNGQKNVIPATQATAGDGLFSQSTGFPAETSLPLGAGGVAPSREDFNGMANLLGGVAYYAQKGWQFQFDAGQDYFAGCIVRDTTDGKLYECLNDVSAGGSVPSADTVNWKEFGVDTSTLAYTDLSNLTQDGEDHFLGRDFTIIYPNGGSESSPATVSKNTRYVETNPFPGYIIACIVEVYSTDNKWGTPFWEDINTGSFKSYGIRVSQFDNDTIVLQTGTLAVKDSSYATGDPWGNSVQLADAPCRVKVWKIGKVANNA